MTKYKVPKKKVLCCTKRFRHKKTVSGIRVRQHSSAQFDTLSAICHVCIRDKLCLGLKKKKKKRFLSCFVTNDPALSTYTACLNEELAHLRGDWTEAINVLH